jgi:hypothetical protein
VQPNVSTEEGVPDYSLFKDEKKVLFIEAKKLSVDVTQKPALRQLAKYCFSEGMRYGLLTNGAVWILFRGFKEGTSVEERIIWKTDVLNDDITAVMRRLGTIRKSNIEDVDNLINKLQMLDDIWQKLLGNQENIVRGLKHVVLELLATNFPEEDFHDIEIEEFLRETVKELIEVAKRKAEIGGRDITERKTEKKSPTKKIEKIKYNRERLLRGAGVHAKRQRKKNILGKKEFWLEFIKEKRLSSAEIVRLCNMVPTLMGGFSQFLTKNGLATKADYDDISRSVIWQIEEEIIPDIRKILLSP